MNTEKNLIHSFEGAQDLPSNNRVRVIHLIAEKRNLVSEITSLLERIAALYLGGVKPQALKTERTGDWVVEGI